jgi:hypothetical protein
MTHGFTEISDAEVCPAPDSEGQGRGLSRQSPCCSGLLQRQLSAAGLGDVAERIAAGSPLELDDAILLSRAAIPLLGRIVQLWPSGRARSTGFSRNECSKGLPEAVLPDGGTTSADLPVERVASASELPRQIAQPLSDWETFCRRLLETRCQLRGTSDTVVWYPQVSEPPDAHRMADEDFTGVDVLRAIALARLVLPANVQIVAPLAALGPKLAQVALEFGASHLGYAASDGEMPDNPLPVDQSVLKELQASCRPTKLKDDP